MTHPLLEAGAGLALLGWGLAQWREGAWPLLPRRAIAALAAPATPPLQALALALLAGTVRPGPQLLGQLAGAPAPARLLLLLLGAGLGATLLALVLALAADGPSLALCTGAGAALLLAHRSGAARAVGRALLGAGCALLALRLLADAARVAAMSAAAAPIAAVWQQDLLLTLAAGAALTLLLRAAGAALLVLGTLAGAGLLPWPAACALALGALLGAPLPGALAVPAAARPAALAHGLLQAAAVAVAALLLRPLAEAARALPLPPGPALASGAIALQLCALPLGPVLAGPLAAFLQRRWPAALEPATPGRLAGAAARRTSVALADALRELARIADQVDVMLRGLLQVILRNDTGLAQHLRTMDDAVDAAYRDVKRHLSALKRRGLLAEEARQWQELMAFAIALEQVADTVQRTLRDLRPGSAAAMREFPPCAFAEVCGLHTLLLHHLRLAVALALERQPQLALDLQAAEAAFADLARTHAQAHLERLAAGEAGSVASSARYLDLLGDLERMNALVCGHARTFLRLHDAGADPGGLPADGTHPACIDPAGPLGRPPLHKEQPMANHKNNPMHWPALPLAAGPGVPPVPRAAQPQKGA